MHTKHLIEVDELSKWYSSREKGILSHLFGEQRYIKAVDNVSFSINQGEIVGLAGQSGCGKSTLADLLLNLQQPTSGSILFNGNPISEYNNEDMKEFRRNCQIIFQDPYESMNPRFTVSRTVAEPLKIHNIGDNNEKHSRTHQALSDAGLNPPGEYLDKIPEELSGGERQRVAIARSLVLDPSFIIADEPVSMLDVSVRNGILNLFQQLKKERDLTMLYISHDLSTIRYVADKTIIMYLGNIVESGPTKEVIHNPSHPYTESLLNSVPHPDPTKERSGSDMGGNIPDPVDLPSGCRFHPNCKYATDECRGEEPLLRELEYYDDYSDQSNGRHVACYHPIQGEPTKSED